MKQIVLITSALLFSILFHQQNFGLNVALFTLITIAILSFFNLEKMRNKQTLFYAGLYVLSGVLVFVNNSFLSYFTNFSAMCLFVGSISEANNSIYIKWINGLSSIIAGFFHRKSEEVKIEDSVETQEEPTKSIDILHWVKLIAIPLTLVILFVVLYSNGNPIFKELIGEINFKFIEFKFILCALIGYAIMTNYSKPIKIKPATLEDLNTSNYLEKNEDVDTETLKKETQLGITILGFLNVLLIGYLITELLFVSRLQSLSAQELSTQLHGGIYTLIISIVIAIITILVLFRGDLNFYKNNKTLKALTYSWIILNTVLVILVVLKNFYYVNQFGFTYKRIGVFVYLLLTIVGLITTILKVKNIKNLWFMLRANTNIAFVILLICTTINWDRTITNYNLTYINNPDLEYLVSLSNSNAEVLKNYNQTHTISNTSSNAIQEKYNNFLSDLYNNNWQEKSLIDFISQKK